MHQFKEGLCITIWRYRNDEAEINEHSKGIKFADLDNYTANGHRVTAIKEDRENEGKYFLKILKELFKRCLVLGDQDECDTNISTPNLTAEIGKVIQTAGKIKLFVSQKLQQLSINNTNQSSDEAFPSTNEGLNGLRDMVTLQVIQTDAMCEVIDTLSKHYWKEITVVEKCHQSVRLEPIQQLTKKLR